MDFRDIKEFFKDTAGYFIVFFTILIINIYFVGLAQVVGPSMEPTLYESNIVIVNKVYPNIGSISRFDMVTVKNNDTKYFIKRIIGMPGDKLYIKDSKLYINDELVNETYLKEDLSYEDFDLYDIGFNEIPEGKYLVLGDNRSNSLDSRNFGLIDKKEITGQVLFRVWPIIK